MSSLVWRFTLHTTPVLDSQCPRKTVLAHHVKKVCPRMLCYVRMCGGGRGGGGAGVSSGCLLR